MSNIELLWNDCEKIAENDLTKERILMQIINSCITFF